MKPNNRVISRKDVIEIMVSIIVLALVVWVFRGVHPDQGWRGAGDFR